MSLLVKAQREGSTIARVTPESAGWRHVGFQRTGWRATRSCTFTMRRANRASSC